MIKLPKITNFQEFFQYGLILLVLLIPLADHSRMSIGYNKVLPVRILEGFLFLAGFWVLLRELGRHRTTIKKIWESLYKDKVFLALVLLWVVRAVSILRSQNLNASLELLIFYTAMIGLYLLMREALLRGRLFVFHLTRIYVYIGLITGLFGLFQYVYSVIGGGKLTGVLVGGDYVRLPATFYDANHFAAYLVTVAPLTIAFAWLAKKFWTKAFWWSCYFIITFVVLYTFSRSGLLGLAVASFLVLLTGILLGYYRKILPLLGALLLVGIVVFVSNATGRSLVTRATSIVNLNEPSTKAHYLLLKGEIELFTKNPIFGVGYGSFSEKFRETETGQEHATVDKATLVRIPAHSVWLEVITETGLIGLSVYLFFAITILGTLIKLIKNSTNKTVRIYSLGFLSGMVGVWTSGFFYSYNLEFFFFFLFLGYLFARILRQLSSEGVILAESQDKETLNWREIVPASFILFASSILVFWNLGLNSLVSSEAVVGATARNLYRSQSLLIPTYLDLPFLGRPPLYYPLATYWMHIYFPHPNFIARLIPALFGVVSIMLTYLIGRKLIGRLGGFMSSILLMLFTPFIYAARTVNTEIIAITFFLAAIYAALFAKKYPLLIILGGFLLGLASLVDGLMTIILLPLYFIFVSVYQKDLKGRQGLLTLSMMVTLIMFLPWHLYIAVRYPVEFFSTYFSRVPNLFTLLPLLALLLVVLLFKYLPRYEKDNKPEHFRRYYLVFLLLTLMIVVLANLNFVQEKISPSNVNQDLQELLMSREFQERSSVPLYINNVSGKVTSFYMDVKYKEIANSEIEKALTQNGTALLITSAERGELLERKFAREEQGLRTIKRAGMLVLMANY